MRLIDADRIVKEYTSEDIAIGGTDIIKTAPTVDAIPISYIKEIIEYWRSLDYGYWDAKIEDFEWLINAWEHDHLVKMKRRLKK